MSLIQIKDNRLRSGQTGWARELVGRENGDDQNYPRARRPGARHVTTGLVAGDAGAYIAERAQASGIDLLVMGAYGHTRLRELVFGGATRHVLREAALPVLFGGWPGVGSKVALSAPGANASLRETKSQKIRGGSRPPRRRPFPGRG